MRKTPATRRLEKQVDELTDQIQDAVRQCDHHSARADRFSADVHRVAAAHQQTIADLNALRIKNQRAIRSLEGEAEYRTKIGDHKAAARLQADIADLAE